MNRSYNESKFASTLVKGGMFDEVREAVATKARRAKGVLTMDSFLFPARFLHIVL